MKISSMLKLLSIVILSSSLFANEDKIISFLKQATKSNKDIKIEKMSVTKSQKIKNMPEWKVYFITTKIHIKKQDKHIELNNVVFSNGKYITKDLIDLDTKQSMKKNISKGKK